MDKLVKYISKNWHKIYLLLSILFIVYFIGMVTGHKRIFPFYVFHNAKLAVDDLIINRNYRHYAKIRPEKFIHEALFEGTGVTINDSDQAFNGYTLITSMWNDTSGLKLFDMSGNELHSWLIPYTSIFPETEPSKGSISDWDVDIHGSAIYPNGDIVFVFNGRGLVKIDKNSNVIWKIKEDYHHSVFIDDSGFIWVPGRITQTSNLERYPALDPPYVEDYICKLSPDGELLEKYPLLEVFYNSGMEALLFADGQTATVKKAHDITHLNDIEVLSTKLGGKFPLFNPGDIMISMRHLNLIIIIDPETRKIKWSQTGPYICQHDPDFMPNGNIILFDNRTDEGGGKVLGGSRILSINPITREFKVEYEGNSQDPFYTSLAGKQQLLPNGNILIVNYEGGRVFEVTESGEIVWSYISRYDEDEVYSVSDAIRIPKNYLTFLN